MAEQQDNETATGRTTVYLRSPELRERLDAWAKSQGRSRNNAILFILQQWLDQHAPVERARDQ